VLHPRLVRPRLSVLRQRLAPRLRLGAQRHSVRLTHRFSRIGSARAWLMVEWVSLTGRRGSQRDTSFRLLVATRGHRRIWRKRGRPISLRRNAKRWVRQLRQPTTGIQCTGTASRSSCCATAVRKSTLLIAASFICGTWEGTAGLRRFFALVAPCAHRPRPSRGWHGFSQNHDERHETRKLLEFFCRVPKEKG